MAYETIDVGSSPNDGLGDKLRNAFIKVVSMLTEVYALIATNIANIATNVTNIATNAADILILENLTASTTQNTDVSTSSTTYSDIGMILNYTPKIAGSKLEVEVNALFEMAATQRGGKLELNYSIDNGSTYNQLEIFNFLKHELGAGIARGNANGTVLIDVPASPTTPLQCIFKLNMSANVAAVAVTLEGASIETILKVTEN